ncbi:TorD/DmsD family molecular chaperone [Aliarcobacter vitoriensis]|uniref:Formate dehydrogenase-specific chaperone n=1 Tax=Aliarcobacter vitoriensis TaxID=2011099 RepID=A0A366MNT1_9BACT|nr:molecular chaperone TorD family protein [Aliarcobacter vitoriensis]RBQ27958.1 hypothetical protein CRU91_11795 [Aliarcobacter vitoriensis]RBQ30370.1 hypothetical protein CRU92_12545 [Arcobacter sp. FW59]
MHSIEIDKARAFIYNLLSLLFVEEYTKTKQDEILKKLEILSENSFSQEVSDVSKELIDYLKVKSTNSIFNEYQDLFLIPFDEYIPLGASWYHERREGGFMQLKVKDVLAKTTIRKDEKSFTAQEDHYGFIFTLSAYLLDKQISKELKDDVQKELFVEVLTLYIDELFYKLIGSSSFIYSRVGVILKEFMGFERAYLDIKS